MCSGTISCGSATIPSGKSGKSRDHLSAIVDRVYVARTGCRMTSTAIALVPPRPARARPSGAARRARRPRPGRAGVRASTTRCCTGASPPGRGPRSCSAACARSTRALRERGSGLVRPPRAARGGAARAGRARPAQTRCTGRATCRRFARGRDRRVTEALGAAGVEARRGRQLRRRRSGRARGRPAVPVFSPFHRAWQDAGAPRRCTARRRGCAAAGESRTGACPRLGALWALDGGGARADRRARGEARRAGGLARRTRDATASPLAGGTCVLSPYLRWGCLSAARVSRSARARRGGDGAQAFRRQLALARLLRPRAAAPPAGIAAPSSRSATAERSTGTTTRSALARVAGGAHRLPARRRRDAPARARRAGCTTARGWSSARS